MPANPLELALIMTAQAFDNDGVDIAIVGYDARIGTAAFCSVSCPECSDYNSMSQALRRLADELDKQSMERLPCEKHVRKN